jgi:hypothetical protein
VKTRLSTCLLLLIFLIGCAPSSEGLSTTSIAETQTFEAAISTALAQTEEAKPTSTPTPPSTPTPSPLPSPFAFQALSKVALESDDVPQNFFSLNPIEADYYENQIRAWYLDSDLTIGNTFFFGDDLIEQYIMGWTILLPDRFIGSGFDMLARFQERVIDMAIFAFDGEEVLEKTNLPNESDLGDDSLGISLLISVEEDPLPMRINAYLFQREMVGVTLLVAYLDRDSPQVQIGNLARILDQKILDCLKP